MSEIKALRTTRDLLLRSWCRCGHRRYDHAGKDGLAACDCCECRMYDDIPEQELRAIIQPALLIQRVLGPIPGLGR